MTLLSSLLDSKTLICVETASYQEININATREVIVQHVIVTPRNVQSLLQQHKKLIVDAVKETTHRCNNLAAGFTGPTMVGLAEDQILVRMAEQITWRIAGRVTLYVSPTAAHDEESVFIKATNLIVAAELLGIAKTRLCVSVPATWEGIQAAKSLKREGIECNMTMVVTMAQAMACAQANVASISPPISAIHEWNRTNNDSPFYDGESMQAHMGINFVKRVAQIFARHNYRTEIIPCDFSTVQEVTKLVGIPKISLPAEMIHKLDTIHGTAANTMDQVHGISLHREADYYSDKAQFQEAARSEPANIYSLLEEELLPDMRSVTDWITTVVGSYMNPYLTPLY